VKNHTKNEQHQRHLSKYCKSVKKKTDKQTQNQWYHKNSKEKRRKKNDLLPFTTIKTSSIFSSIFQPQFTVRRLFFSPKALRSYENFLGWWVGLEIWGILRKFQISSQPKKSYLKVFHVIQPHERIRTIVYLFKFTLFLPRPIKNCPQNFYSETMWLTFGWENLWSIRKQKHKMVVIPDEEKWDNSCNYYFILEHFWVCFCLSPLCLPVSKKTTRVSKKKKSAIVFIVFYQDDVIRFANNKNKISSQNLSGHLPWLLWMIIKQRFATKKKGFQSMISNFLFWWFLVFSPSKN